MCPEQNTDLARTTFAEDLIPEWANAFYQAKKVEGLSRLTLVFYKQQLGHFLKYCEAQVITRLGQLTPVIVRAFLLAHEESGHNAGGLHAAYRVLKTFLRWYEFEAEPDNWKNPITKVKAPKLPDEQLDPVNLDTVRALLKTCDKDFLGLRDRAILLALLDTGARATELLTLDITDVDLVTGSVVVRRGKGGKGRIVFLGKNARRAMRAYLKARNDDNQALWISRNHTRLTYSGLRGMIIRRADKAEELSPGLHDFRRAFALACKRANMDNHMLQKLMGQTTPKVLERYLKLDTDDLRTAHGKASPGDQL